MGDVPAAGCKGFILISSVGEEGGGGNNKKELKIGSCGWEACGPTVPLAGRRHTRRSHTPTTCHFSTCPEPRGVGKRSSILGIPVAVTPGRILP